MSEQIKLIRVDGNGNNNKYYNMTKNGDGTFTAVYGRVNTSVVTHTYPIDKWDLKLKEKLKKQYKDITEISTSATISGASIKEDDVDVSLFIKKMLSYTRELVERTYLSESATESQIAEAQNIINNITNYSNTKDIRNINKMLEELYIVIPRKMKKVKDMLLPNVDIIRHLQNEQDNIDALKANTNSTPNKSFLESIDTKMIKVNNHSNLEYIIKQIENKYKIKKIFEVQKDKDKKDFDNMIATKRNKKTRFLIHGTRPASVLHILKDKLRIKPSGNFQFSGKNYGDGNYFSEVVSKSMNYTGRENDKVLLIYEVHTGNPFIYDGWFKGNSFSLNYKNLNDRGFDSTYVKAGNGLLNSEIISYHENQARIANIIWI